MLLGAQKFQAVEERLAWSAPISKNRADPPLNEVAGQEKGAARPPEEPGFRCSPAAPQADLQRMLAARAGCEWCVLFAGVWGGRAREKEEG